MDGLANHAEEGRYADAAGQKHRGLSPILVQFKITGGTRNSTLVPNGQSARSRLYSEPFIRMATCRFCSKGALAKENVLEFPSQFRVWKPVNTISTYWPAFAERRAKQAEAVSLPILPTTTIGSFPQTKPIRQARVALRSGQLSKSEYENFLQDEINYAIRLQEELGLDVLVHGEFERNDMVEYFAEQLDGFAFTRNGGVQSYGSRCVKPPVLFGDVTRPAPMSVAWSRYAQSLTRLPVKGMLAGPVTMSQWSFVRDDLPREQVCRQLALALRDEVRDLEAAGLRIIQVDEPALREGLPLHRKDRPDYLRWAVAAFRLATAPPTTPRFTPTCATPSLEKFFLLSGRWMPM